MNAGGGRVKAGEGKAADPRRRAANLPRAHEEVGGGEHGQRGGHQLHPAVPQAVAEGAAERRGHAEDAGDEGDAARGGLDGEPELADAPRREPQVPPRPLAHVEDGDGGHQPQVRGLLPRQLAPRGHGGVPRRAGGRACACTALSEGRLVRSRIDGGELLHPS